METQQHILHVADDLARRSGYAAFSFADLAKAVGIRKASVHHHFPTKADLAVRLLQDYRHDIEARLARFTGTSSQKIAAFLTMYREALGYGDRMCLCVSFAAGRDTLPDAAKAEVVAFQEMVVEWLRSVFAEAQSDRTIAGIGDPESEARGALALVEGAQLLAHAAQTPEDFERSTAVLAARLKKEK